MRASLCSVLIVGLFLVAGCTSTGLSMRESPGDFSTIALSLHDVAAAAVADTQPSTPMKPASFPVRLAVVQLGEIAPPEDMLAALRKHGETFTDVQAVPSAFTQYNNVYARQSPSFTTEQAMNDRKALVRQQVESMRVFARDGGADYLLLFGGTVDRATTSTPLSVLDLTIIGMFVVPSKQILAEGRAGATLIDVRTGRSVLTFNAQSKGDRLAPTATRDNAELKLVRDLRDDLTRDLAKQLAERIHHLSDPPRVARAE